MGNLIKRLVERAHKHEHQRLTQELSEKEQLLQEQASQLHAMTADRDKWMMDHQQLVVRLHSVFAFRPACLPEYLGHITSCRQPSKSVTEHEINRYTCTLSFAFKGC